MMLGTDVSGLSTTAANAAAQGLSIVVPLYNEAAGLAPAARSGSANWQRRLTAALRARLRGRLCR